MFDIVELGKVIGFEFTHVGLCKISIFESILPPGDANSKSLIFISKPDNDSLHTILETKADVILLEIKWGMQNQSELNKISKSIFLVDQPRLIVSKLLKEMYPDEDTHFKGIHPTAIIDAEAQLHSKTTIGPNCIIGKCIIGEDSRIDAFSTVKDRVKIGKRVIIREHCTIGGTGFSFPRDNNGILHRTPHIGGVRIEDDVQIFQFVNVDSGTLTETLIRRGTKIDHYAHIGHNTSVGEDCIIAAGVVLCGKSKLGSRSWAGVNCVIKEGIKVGKDCIIGISAVVLNDVNDNTTVVGVPAKEIKRK